MSDNLDLLILPKPGGEQLRLNGACPRPDLAHAPALTGALRPRVLGSAR
jgi:hypothetical protein